MWPRLPLDTLVHLDVISYGWTAASNFALPTNRTWETESLLLPLTFVKRGLGPNVCGMPDCQTAAKEELAFSSSGTNLQVRRLRVPQKLSFQECPPRMPVHPSSKIGRLSGTVHEP